MTLAFLLIALAGPVAYWEGSDLTGGAAALFGAYHHGEGPVNYVYSAASGARSSMEVRFSLDAAPGSQGAANISAGQLFLHLRGRDDDAPGECRVRIEINAKVIHDGPSGFPSDAWAVRRIPIAAGTLKSGENHLTIRNIEEGGVAGMPPWFMVARAAIASEDYVLRRDIRRDFRFRLPDAKRPFPEPLSAGDKPGFAVRGTKGWLWKPEQYLAEIPWIARCRMNFLMNCYGSMCDIETYPWGA